MHWWRGRPWRVWHTRLESRVDVWIVRSRRMGLHHLMRIGGSRTIRRHHRVWAVGGMHQRRKHRGLLITFGKLGGRSTIWTEGPQRRFEWTENGTRGRWDGTNLDAFAGDNFFETVESKAGYLALNKSLTLGELKLETLCVASGGEGMAMPVLLVAGSAGC